MNQLEAKFSPRAFVVLACLLALVFAINVLTASRYPVVWADEVRFVDPGATLYVGNGFRSTGWWGQPDDEFFASYAPLYPMAIAGWLNLSPLTPTGVRSLNYLLIVLSGLVLWLVIVRQGLVRSPFYQMLLVALVTLGYGVSFSYRSGRSDICH